LTTALALDKISLKFTKDPAAGCFHMKVGSVVGCCHNYQELLNNKRFKSSTKSDDGDIRPVAAIFREPVGGANRWADRLYAHSRGESPKGAALSL